MVSASGIISSNLFNVDHEANIQNANNINQSFSSEEVSDLIDLLNGKENDTTDLNIIGQSFHQKKGLTLNQIPFTSHENLQLKKKNAATKNQHTGQLNLNLIVSKIERAKIKSVRRKTLFKKVN